MERTTKTGRGNGDADKSRGKFGYVRWENIERISGYRVGNRGVSGTRGEGVADAFETSSPANAASLRGDTKKQFARTRVAGRATERSHTSSRGSSSFGSLFASCVTRPAASQYLRLPPLASLHFAVHMLATTNSRRRPIDRRTNAGSCARIHLNIQMQQ